ncbi:Autophagy protein Apg6 containing protein [Aphelenchoides avenae]|nr:Autophagy protein Apg6 containing protein [Aphelenchus avenae]
MPATTPHCLVCHSKLKLDPSLGAIKEEETHEDPVLASLDTGDQDSLGVIQSGNLLEMICNSKTPLKTPMCKKCSTTVASELNSQLATLERECLNYKTTLEELGKKRESNAFDPSTAKTRLAELQDEETDLTKELEALEVEETHLLDQLAVKQDEQRLISEQDEMLYRKLRDNHRSLIDLSDEERSLRAQIDYADDQIKRLTRVNILDTAFFIWTDGEYGTINGLRLGRLPHDMVEWYEINAALGQIALLLTVMAEYLELAFNDYEIVPCGSHSFIRLRTSGEKSEELPLYGTGGWRPFGQSALDQGIAAYLDCFRQFESRLKSYFPPDVQGTHILPYKMTKDKIIEQDSQYLVKMQLNSEERWTKAMKCLLINLKWSIKILANLRRTSSQSSAT